MFEVSYADDLSNEHKLSVDPPTMTFKMCLSILEGMSYFGHDLSFAKEEVQIDPTSLIAVVFLSNVEAGGKNIHIWARPTPSSALTNFKGFVNARDSKCPHPPLSFRAKMMTNRSLLQ